MNIAKNMEAIFVVALTLTCMTSIATATTAAPADPVAMHLTTVSDTAPLQVVTITTKRLPA